MEKIYGSNLNYNNENDKYELFFEAINNYFKTFTDINARLFNVDTKNLFDIYLENIPLEARQHYNCSCCKKFIEKYGNLITIDNNGKAKSVLWNEDLVPDFFKKSVRHILKEVENSVIKNVFISNIAVLGKPTTNGWKHLSVTLPNELLNKSSLKNKWQLIAEKTEDFNMLSNACSNYDLSIAKKAFTLLKSETLYRSDRILGVAKWFYELLKKRENNKNSIQKDNITWLAVATAPVGFCHIKSSMIGSLLDDLKEGLAVQSAISRFNEKMNPANYQRSQSAPSQNAIYEAEKLVLKLGISESLKRRYARYEEIPEFIWENNFKNQPKNIQNENKVFENKVFGHLKPKNSTDKMDDLPQSKMTWDKFKKTILPTAQNIEVKINNPSRFIALVTASNESAPNILQWDNKTSWYYHGGIDGEIKKRVEDAGGRYENNEIRCSLIWESYSDLDLHCINPKGEHIFYRDKRDRFDGYLDVDMNAGGPHTLTPVENIRWITNAPAGLYRFYVHNYADRNKEYNPYKVELNVNGKIYNFSSLATSTNYSEDVFVFDYEKNKHPKIKTQTNFNNKNQWNVENDSFVKVKGIVASPNLWGENKIIHSHSGNHTFFLLEDCKDLSEGKGRGFFIETLKPELREIRKVLELYTANTPIEDLDNATACGVGYSKDSEWDLSLRVTSDDSIRIINIDRFD